jgi:alpha/beta superfamily hydrolase
MANLSANTETTVCVNDENNCATNPIVVYPPHPVYNGTSGNTVMQLNMIVLGGQNGLNA